MFQRNYDKLLDRFQPACAIVKLWTLRIWVKLIPAYKLDKTFVGGASRGNAVSRVLVRRLQRHPKPGAAPHRVTSSHGHDL